MSSHPRNRAALEPLLSAPAVLTHGAVVDVRRATPADADALVAFHEQLSLQSRWMRFLGGGADVGTSVRALTRPDIVGFVASAGAPIVAHACLVPTGRGTAEFAVAVADDWQQQGVGTALLERLVEAAEPAGIDTIVAFVHPANRRMLEVFRDLGMPSVTGTEEGLVRVELGVRRGAWTSSVFEARHRQAAVAGLDHLLRPGSIAVAGSTRAGTVGGELMRNIAGGGFTGRLYAISRSAGSIPGMTCAASLGDLPEVPEVVMAAIPAEHVLDLAAGCAQAGVRALVVISDGFGEAGPTGRRRQQALLDICRGAGMRLVGPNCLGVLNTDEAIRLNGVFAPQPVPAGAVALASQSGTMGILAMHLAARRGLGLSSFVSLGDRADVSSNDLLRYWAEDPRTEVIGLYLESFGNPRSFAAVARMVSAAKPIIAVKGGSSSAGGRAASSHTGAMVEGSDALTDALFDDAGIVRVETIGELLDTAAVLARGRPRGRRIGILTNGGGAGIACADACEREGLSVPHLRPTTRAALRAARPGAAVGNPVDLLADAGDDAFAAALPLLAADTGVDAIVALHVPPLAGRSDDPLAVVAARAGDLPVPVVAVPLAASASAPVTERVAVLDSPEDAARALARAARYAPREHRPPQAPATPRGLDRAAVAAVVAHGLAQGGGWLAPELVSDLLGALGIPVPAERVASSPTGVAAAARAIGGSVAIKAVAAGLVHKSDAGAIRLGLQTPADAQRAATQIAGSVRAAGYEVEGFLVQAMAPKGVELLVGATSHPTFGPIVACGAGGVTAELVHDVQVRLAPVDKEGARRMIRELRCYPLLDGWRGAPRLDVAAAADAVRRLALLVDEHPTVLEAECNPLVVTTGGAVAVDARVRLTAP